MAIACPSCGLTNPDGAVHCDCGRALDGGVDKRLPAASVRRGRRRLYVAVAIAVACVAAGIAWQRCTRAPAALALARRVCGDKLDEKPVRHDGVDYTRLSCTNRQLDGHSVDVIVDQAARVAHVRLAVHGSAGDEAALRDHAIELLDDVLDRDQRDAARRTLASIIPATGRATREQVGDVTIDGRLALWLNAPDRRYASLELAIAPYALDELAGTTWAKGFPPTVDARVIAQLQAVCGAGTWRTGDLYAVCDGKQRFEVLWNPQRHVTSIRIGEPAPLEAIVRPLVGEASWQLVAAGEPIAGDDISISRPIDGELEINSR